MANRCGQSCISEAQKYEGKLYKDKSKRKSVTIAIPGEEPPRKAYVEDVPDEPGSAVAVIEHMPQAPSPPPSAAAQPVNVFDFLVGEATPNASRVSLGGSHEQMCMVDHAPPLFNKSLSSSPESAHADNYNTHGYAYGTAPMQSHSYDTYRTPASKPVRRSHHAHSGSTDKKRKRQVEELDLSRASRSSAEVDDEMVDATGPDHPILHSGLTGGLNRLLAQTSANFPPSPDYSGDAAAPDPSPLSPAKRKRATTSSTLGISTGNGILTVEKRGRRRPGATNHAGQLVKVRKVRRSSDESRPRKRSTAHHRSEGSPPVPKQIEYHPARHDGSPAGRAENAMVVYRSRAELFLSLVSKGPDSEHGYSINKALKRYHRERGSVRDIKADEEKELWKSLRLKRNERGEVVVFME